MCPSPAYSRMPMIWPILKFSKLDDAARPDVVNEVRRRSE